MPPNANAFVAVLAVAAVVAVVAVAALPVMFPLIVLLNVALPVNVLFPATDWVVVRSTKFCVLEPVPPFATGTTPLRLIVGFCPAVAFSGPEAATLSTPVLFSVTLPPKATLPPPARPVPAVTVSEGLANSALVTPPAAMLMFGVVVELATVSGAVPDTLVTVPLPGKLCPAAKVI